MPGENTKIEEIQGLIDNAACPSLAVDAVETWLNRHRVRTHGDTETYAAINATVWLLVVSRLHVKLLEAEKGNQP